MLVKTSRVCIVAIVVLLVFSESTSVVVGRFREPCEQYIQCSDCLKNPNCGIYAPSAPASASAGDDPLLCLTGSSSGPFFVDREENSQWFFSGGGVLTSSDQSSSSSTTTTTNDDEQFKNALKDCQDYVNNSTEMYSDDDDEYSEDEDYEEYDDDDEREELNEEEELEEEMEEMEEEIEEEIEADMELEELDELEKLEERIDDDDVQMKTTVESKDETHTVTVASGSESSAISATARFARKNRGMMGAEVVMVAAVVVLMVALGTINAGKTLVRKFRPD